MAYRVKVRRGPVVERSRAPTLEAALDALEAAARDAARSERPAPVELRVRRYDPGDQVVARIEIAGPTRLAPSVRAGVDVRGDSAMTAWMGGMTKQPVDEAGDETAIQALRRALAG